MMRFFQAMLAASTDLKQILWMPLTANKNDISSIANTTFQNGSPSYDATKGIYIGNSTVTRVQVADNDRFTWGNGSNDLPFTILLEAKWDNVTSPNRYLVSKWGGSASNYEWSLTYSNGILNFYIGDANFSNYIRGFGSSFTPNTTDQYKIGVSYDGSGSASGIKIQVNGVSLTMTATSVGTYVTTENTTTEVTMGTVSAGFPVDGWIKNVKIYAKELTLAEQVEEQNIY